MHWNASTVNAMQCIVFFLQLVQFNKFFVLKTFGIILFPYARQRQITLKLYFIEMNVLASTDDSHVKSP